MPTDMRIPFLGVMKVVDLKRESAQPFFVEEKLIVDEKAVVIGASESPSRW